MTKLRVAPWAIFPAIWPGSTNWRSHHLISTYISGQFITSKSSYATQTHSLVLDVKVVLPNVFKELPSVRSVKE